MGTDKSCLNECKVQTSYGLFTLMGVKKKILNLANWIFPIGILVSLVIVWEVLVRVVNVPSWQLPPPSAILDELIVSKDLLFHHTLVTLKEIVVGFSVALVTGLTLAAGIAYSRILERSVYPIIIASQTIPIIAIAPLLLIWVGYGLTPKVIIVALICFYPIAVNTVDGLKSIDPDMISMFRTLGASRFQVFTKLQVPNSLPFMFSGIKIGISVSVIAAVIGEWVGGSEGLGYLITYSQPLFLTARVFAAIFLLSVMGIILFVLGVWIEHLTMPWHFNAKRSRAMEMP
tara:strand:+ start:762 stop:1625 length:864 start_codon:yes stop_codon:yes gene_type:complete